MSAEPRKINSKSRPAPKASGSGKKKINSCLEVSIVMLFWPLTLADVHFSFQCRRRKIKCNRIIPCDRCIERGEKSLCQEAAIDEVFLPHASNTLSHSHGQIRNRVSSSDLLLSIDARLEELVYRVRTLEDNAGISPQSEPGTRPPMRQDSPDVSVNNDLETEEVVHLLEVGSTSQRDDNTSKNRRRIWHTVGMNRPSRLLCIYWIFKLLCDRLRPPVHLLYTRPDGPCPYHNTTWKHREVWGESKDLYRRKRNLIVGWLTHVVVQSH